MALVGSDIAFIYEAVAVVVPAVTDLRLRSWQYFTDTVSVECVIERRLGVGSTHENAVPANAECALYDARIERSLIFGDGILFAVNPVRWVGVIALWLSDRRRGHQCRAPTSVRLVSCELGDTLFLARDAGTQHAELGAPLDHPLVDRAVTVIVSAVACIATGGIVSDIGYACAATRQPFCEPRP